MLKNVIAPIQAWLLSRGKCVGCGTLISKGTKEDQTSTLQKITCKKCNRIFIYDKKKKSYRRALFSEV